MFLCLRDGKRFSGGVHTAESLAGTAAALQRGARFSLYGTSTSDVHASVGPLRLFHVDGRKKRALGEKHYGQGCCACVSEKIAGCLAESICRSV